LLETLQDLAAQLEPTRQIAIARELTKLHEEFWRGDLEGAIAHYTAQAPRGEFTLVIDGAADTQIVWTQAQLLSELKAIMLSGVSRSQASRQLAAISLLPRRQLYQLALSIDLEQSLAITD
jgi:16S rRNA (cytidine1402-2'-O)-methyltransferase